jgi:hypothetical protein
MKKKIVEINQFSEAVMCRREISPFIILVGNSPFYRPAFSYHSIPDQIRRRIDYQSRKALSCLEHPHHWFVKGVISSTDVSPGAFWSFLKADRDFRLFSINTKTKVDSQNIALSGMTGDIGKISSIRSRLQAFLVGVQPPAR